MTQNIAHIAMTFLLIAGLTGCQSVNYRLYEGEERLAGEVAHLELPHIAQLRSVDGLPLNRLGRMTTSETTTYTLLPGRHKLAVRYHEIWPISDDEHETLASDPVVIEGTFEAGAVYRIEVQAPRDIKDARVFIIKPVIGLSKVSEKPTSHKHTKSALSAAPTVPASESATPAPVETEETLPAAGASLKELKQSWRKANPQERKTFRKWIVDH